MLTTSRRFLLASIFVATFSRPALAVDALAISDLTSQADGTIRFPIHDPGFGERAKARVSTEVGRIESAVPTGGIIEVAWSPPENFEGGPVTFRVRFKDPAGTKRDKTFRLDVPAAASRPIQASASPAVVAPDVEEVTLSWTAPPSGQAPASRRYAVAASMGQLGPVQVASDGTATVTWRRPAKLEEPVMALVTIVDETDPRRRGRVELPLQVARSSTFQVPPDAKVTVQIGDDTMGPKQASPAGTVAFDLRLDPRVREGRLSGRTPLGEVVDQVVALPNLAQPAVVLALPPRPQASTAPIPVAAAVWLPDDAPTPTLTTDTGTLQLEEPADGWLTGTLSLAPETTGSVSLQAEIGDAVSKGSVEVVLGVPSVAATAEPTELRPGQRDVTLRAKSVDALQRPVADTVGLRAVDGTVLARPSRRGDTTTARFRKAKDADGLTVLAEPPGAVAGQPVAAVLPWLVPLGDEALLLRVAVTDSAGRGIAEVPISVSVNGKAPAGLPKSLTTDGYGMAYAKLDAFTGALGLELSAGGHTGSVGWTPDGRMVTGGDSEWLRKQQMWAGSAPTLLIPTQAPAPVVAAAPTAPAAAPVPSPPVDTTAPGPEPRREREPRSPSDVGKATLRAAVGFQASALTYTATTTDGAVGPLSAIIDGAGITGGGLAGHLLAWPGAGSWGLEADARYEQATLSPVLTFAELELSAEELAELEDLDDPDALADLLANDVAPTFERSALDLRVGARYRAPLTASLDAYGLVQVHRQEADLFVWADGEVAHTATPLLGARVGGGAMVEAGPIWVDVQVAETFAPYPIRLEVDSRIQATIRPHLAIHAGGGMAWRSMVFTIDESELLIKDQQAQVIVGLATSWP